MYGSTTAPVPGLASPGAASRVPRRPEKPSIRMPSASPLSPSTLLRRMRLVMVLPVMVTECVADTPSCTWLLSGATVCTLMPSCSTVSSMLPTITVWRAASTRMPWASKMWLSPIKRLRRTPKVSNTSECTEIASSPMWEIRHPVTDTLEHSDRLIPSVAVCRTTQFLTATSVLARTQSPKPRVRSEVMLSSVTPSTPIRNTGDPLATPTMFVLGSQVPRKVRFWIRMSDDREVWVVVNRLKAVVSFQLTMLPIASRPSIVVRDGMQKSSFAVLSSCVMPIGRTMRVPGLSRAKARARFNAALLFATVPSAPCSASR